MKLPRQERLKFLSKQHEVYALNETVPIKIKGKTKILHFEPSVYHTAMARFYREQISERVRT